MLPAVAAAGSVVRAMPRVIDVVAKKPGVMNKVKGFLSKITGKEIANVSAWARASESNARVALEGFVRNGVSIENLQLQVPLLSRPELSEFISGLREIEASMEDAVLGTRSGVITSMNGPAVAQQLTIAKQHALLLKRRLGARNLDDLEDILTAIGGLSKNDLQQIKLVYGEI